MVEYGSTTTGTGSVASTTFSARKPMESQLRRFFKPRVLRAHGSASYTFGAFVCVWALRSRCHYRRIWQCSAPALRPHAVLAEDGRWVDGLPDGGQELARVGELGHDLPGGGELSPPGLLARHERLDRRCVERVEGARRAGARGGRGCAE